MSDKVPKHERLLNLLAVLLAARRPVPFSEVAGRVIGYDDDAQADSLEKRFDRDKAELRDLGVPVRWVPEGAGAPGGYTVDRGAAFQRRIVLRDAEAVLLAIAGRVGAAATGGGALLDALKSALRKLAVDLPADDPCDVAVPLTTVRATTAAPEARDALAFLVEAISREQRVRFGYRGREDEQARIRRVSPHGVGLVRGAWYLVGWCHDRAAMRVFKLARVHGAPAADPGGPLPADRIPPDFSVSDHLPQRGWAARGADRETVWLRLTGPPERHVFAAGAHMKVLAREGDRVTVTIQVPHALALTPWVLSCAGDVEVLAPVALRAAVHAAATAVVVGRAAEAAP